MPGQRELLAVREIVHAFLFADRPEEAFQFALDRVAPVVGAAFASVYRVDGASELMRLVAAHNWPERLRPWLADVRIRVGFGPSGEAASERRPIEVPDVFADADLEDWQEVARELGFRAIVSLPLQVTGAAVGAVTFYFRDWADFTPERRGLLRLVADLMAGAAEKAMLLERVRRAEAAATDATADLDRQLQAARDARRSRAGFVDLAAAAMRDAIAATGAHGPAAEHALGLLGDLELLVAAETGGLTASWSSVDPRVPLREAMRTVAAANPGAHPVAEEPIHPMPAVRADAELLARVLAKLVERALPLAPAGAVHATVTVVAGRVEYRVPGEPGDDLGWRFALAVGRGIGAKLSRDEGQASPTVVLAIPVGGDRAERQDSGA